MPNTRGGILRSASRSSVYGITDDNSATPSPATRTHGSNQRRSAVGHAERHGHQRRDGHSQSQAVAFRGVAAQRRADQDVQAPERSRGEGEQNTDKVEVAASLHQQDHTACREHGPERVQPSPRPGQGHRQRPEELDGDRDPQRDPGQRQVEAQVHQAENHAVAEHHCPRATIHAQRRPPQQHQHRRREEQSQRDRPEAAHCAEQVLGQCRAHLNADDAEQYQCRWRDRAEGASGQRGQGGSRRTAPRIVLSTFMVATRGLSTIGRRASL